MDYTHISSVSTTQAVPDVEKPSLLRRSVAIMKPITWFAPMWAFLCGAIASGAMGWNMPDMGRIFLGVIMAGPILCGLSQVINDYFDRDVDALNEPDRLIPAGLISVQQVIGTFTVLLIAGISISLYLGQSVAVIVLLGLIMAVAYSAPPIRAKRNGWIGNTLVAISYEGFAWLAGHAAFETLTASTILIAALYSFGAHGIMSINDYKSIAGDRLANIRTIPVIHGPKTAAWLIIFTMNLAQLGVIAAFLYWGAWITAAVITLILIIQIPLQWTFVKDPTETYLKFSAIGVSFFVWGMMAAAIGLRYVQ